MERRSLPAAEQPASDALALRRSRGGEERSWLTVMAVTTVVELAWWGAAWSAGIAPTIRLAPYLGIALVTLSAAALLRVATGRAPSAAPWPAVLTGTGLIAVGASAFLPLKYAIPREIPFWLDQQAALGERALFGSDPWLLLDHVASWAAMPMDWLYAAWLPTQLLLLFLLLLAPPSAAKSRALTAYDLIWFLLGAVAAVLLSSAGPIFYDRLYGGETFAGLANTLRSRGAELVIAESDRMWASYSGGQAGLVAGMSAFPSIHVAISCWLVLTARSIAPRLLPIAVLYLALIWFGSVQLGWHYASDGLVGVIGTLALWPVAAFLCRAQAKGGAFPPRLAPPCLEVIG